jgi:hypothetical protein
MATRINLSEFANELAIFQKNASAFVSFGINPEDMVIKAHDGHVLVVTPAKGESPEHTIEITAGATESIMAALAELPQYRARFAAQVMAKIEQGRAGDAFLKGIADLEKARARVTAAIVALQSIDAANAAPFKASHFIDVNNVEKVVAKSAVASKGAGMRSRSPSETKWSLEQYDRDFNGSTLYLRKHGPKDWSVEDVGGSVLAVGDSGNSATRAYLAELGYSTSVSAPAWWGAAAQELAAEGE